MTESTSPGQITHLAGAQQVAVLSEVNRHRAAGVQPAGQAGQEAGGHVLHDDDRSRQPAGQAREQRAERARAAGRGADDDERHVAARGGRAPHQPAPRMADDADAGREQQAGPQVSSLRRWTCGAGLGRLRRADDDVHRSGSAQFRLGLRAGQSARRRRSRRESGCEAIRSARAGSTPLGRSGSRTTADGRSRAARLSRSARVRASPSTTKRGSPGQDRAHAAAGQRRAAGDENADIARLRGRPRGRGQHGFHAHLGSPIARAAAGPVRPKVATSRPRSTRPPCSKPSVAQRPTLRRLAGSRECQAPRRIPLGAAARLVRAGGARPSVATAGTSRHGKSWSARSCCSRRRWRGCSRPTRGGSSDGRLRRTWRPHRPVMRYASGAGSVTRGARCGCMRRRWPASSAMAARCRARWRSYARCRVSAVTRRPLSRLSRTALAVAVVDTNVRRVVARWLLGPARGGRDPRRARHRPASGAAAGCREDVDRPDGAGRAGVHQPRTALRRLPAVGRLPLARRRRADGRGGRGTPSPRPGLRRHRPPGSRPAAREAARRRACRRRRRCWTPRGRITEQRERALASLLDDGLVVAVTGGYALPA